MNKAQQDILDVEFIVSEICRLSCMTPDEIRLEFKNDRFGWFFHVPHPSGSGISLCGRVAHQKLCMLAKRHLQVMKDLKNRVDPGKFQQAMTAELSNMFLRDRKKIEEKNISRMLSAAVKSVRTRVIDLTHYIPCIIVSNNVPDNFTIGPVKFVWMEHFLECNRAEIELKKEAPFPEMLLTYFSQFRWVAEVTVQGCDQTTSKMRAHLLVEGSLNVLRLLIGHKRGLKLRQGHAPSPLFETAWLVRDREGRLGISGHKEWAEERFEDNWFDHLEHHARRYLEMAGEVLKNLLDPSSIPHLRQRILDAITWYGEAVTELAPATQIVKSVAALERITLAEKKSDCLTQTVSKRTALLCCEGKPEEYEKYLCRAKKIYDSRSELMHGSQSPFDEKLQAIANEALDIARFTILVGLEFFFALEQSKTAIKPSDLERAYQSLEERTLDHPVGCSKRSSSKAAASERPRRA